MVVALTREIAAPAERVWRLAVDWERQSAWIPATTVRLLPGPREGLGTRVEAVTGVGPLRLLVDPMEVVEWDPPRLCVTRHDGNVLRGTGTFGVEPLGRDRCRFTWREDLELPGGPLVGGAYRVGSRLSTPFLAYAVGRLARLAASPDEARRS